MIKAAGFWCPARLRLDGKTLRDLQVLDAFTVDCRGAVAVPAAISLVVLLGFAGLGSEVASWYVSKRAMQGAADTAAYSAAYAKAANASVAAYTSEATSVAGSYGFVDGTNGVTITVNSPPASGRHAGDNTAVEVIITRPQPLAFAALFLKGPPTLQAQSVATPGATGCVLALDRGNVTDVSDNGNTTLNLNHCNIYVNSVSNSALSLVGGATINANAAYISGNYSTGGHAALNTIQGIHTQAAPANDPYADVQIPSYQGCNQTNYSLTAGQSKTFTAGSSPMVFCNGFSLAGGSRVTFDPGVYIFDRGSFSMTGNSSLAGSGPGVTMIFASSTGSNFATVSIAGGSTVTITAPTSGPLSGLAFFQDRNAPSTGSNSFAGGATQNVTGAIYFPNQNVTFNGGTATGGATCTQLIAYTITFNGNSTFNNNCPGVGVRGVGNALVQLVE
jgi:hypothetical protein